MRGIEFYRVSGSGNDFIALPEPAEEPAAETIRAWCRRGVSVGADGLFTLRRGAPGRVVMRYRNADGGEAGLCLNGTRCAARLAFHLGWAEHEVTVETGAGPLAARRLEDAVAVAAPPPTAPEPLTLEAEGTPWTAWRLTIGVPHLVLLWPDDLATAPVATLGRALRHHPALAPQGANVDFVRLFPDHHHLDIRTYERGVEAETLACGTGVLAATATLLATADATLPLTAHTKGGYPLTVTGPDPDHWQLAGDARLLTHGHLLPDALDTPTPPDWR